jgi:hypothetical protein
MGDVVYFNNIRENGLGDRLRNEQEASLFNFFQDVREGFEERGYTVVDILVVPNECPNSNSWD